MEKIDDPRVKFKGTLIFEPQDKPFLFYQFLREKTGLGILDCTPAFLHIIAKPIGYNYFHLPQTILDTYSFEKNVFLDDIWSIFRGVPFPLSLLDFLMSFKNLIEGQSDFKSKEFGLDNRQIGNNTMVVDMSQIDQHRKSDHEVVHILRRGQTWKADVGRKRNMKMLPINSNLFINGKE